MTASDLLNLLDPANNIRLINSEPELGSLPSLGVSSLDLGRSFDERPFLCLIELPKVNAAVVCRRLFFNPAAALARFRCSAKNAVVFCAVHY